MSEPETFSFSSAEATKMRRGVFAPPVLILPFALILGLEPGKSQPLHFITVLGIGLLITAVIVAIVFAGVRNQIAQRLRNSLVINIDALVLNTEFGAAPILYSEITNLTVRRGLRSTRAIDLQLAGGKSLRLDGYENMDKLAAALQEHLPASSCSQKSWYQI